MELDIAYLEADRYGRYLVAMADSHNAVLLIQQGWKQITKEQYDNPTREYAKLDLTIAGQKARIL
jgi:hypothetical protein